MRVVAGIYPYTDASTEGGEVFLDEEQSSYYFPEEVELMQSTGLTDRLGVEIFESDLLLCEDRIVQVVWSQTRAMFDTTFVSFVEEPTGTFSELVNSRWHYRVTVIGNVWEGDKRS
jgi:uncharacterized phage protein (TIGR01671 family)